MPTTATVKFQGGSVVFVQALANASYTQVITITPPSGPAAVFQGSGEGNVPLPLTPGSFLTPGTKGGQASFMPPGGSSTLSTYKIAVTANGKPSQVEANSSSITTPSGSVLNLATALSEDSADQDYNDGTVMFMQYTP